MRRVVVTGMAGISPIGTGWSAVEDSLRKGSNAVQVMDDWKKIVGLNTCLGAPIIDFAPPEHYTRKSKRSMGRVGRSGQRNAGRAADAGRRSLASWKCGAER